MSGPNPSGICWCGCGQQTKRAKRHQTASGQRKGDYSRYCHGHAGSRAAAEAGSAYWLEAPGPLETPCHIWQGAVNSKGYPSRQLNGRRVSVHRESLETELGRQIKTGRQAHHRCRNPRCVNGSHLEELTPLQHKHAHMRTQEVAA